VEVEYQLTEDEYVEAQLGYWRQARRFNMIRLEMVLASVLVLFAAVVFALPGIADKVPAWGAICLSTLLLLNRYVVAPYKIRRIFRRSPNTRAPHRLAIDDENLRIVLPDSSEDLRWEAFQRAHELKAEFLLMYGPRSFVIVPKRAFDREGLDDFSRVLRHKHFLQENLQGQFRS
jgi:hypothetical protein